MVRKIKIVIIGLLCYITAFGGDPTPFYGNRKFIKINLSDTTSINGGQIYCDSIQICSPDTCIWLSPYTINNIKPDSTLYATQWDINKIQPDSITYNTAFPFNKCLTYMYHELTDNDSITINSTGAINQGGGQILFKNNPSYIPRLGCFHVVGQTIQYNLTGVYDNTKSYSLCTFIRVYGMYIVSILNFN